MLSIRGLTKRYGDRVAVDHLDLEVGAGELWAFIGHNGAGKTTTLKACMGLIDFEGDIFVDGHSVREEPLTVKREVAYIPDNPDLYEFLTGIRYLHFVADVYGVGQERGPRIRELSDRFELTQDLGEPIASYSHGMKQKLAIIAAYLHRPRLIIMDEPFVGLDPRAAYLLKEMMREHCAAGGSIFFSTHVLDVAERLCDKVAIIKHGRLVEAGPMAAVRGNSSLESVFLELEEERHD